MISMSLRPSETSFRPRMSIPRGSRFVANNAGDPKKLGTELHPSAFCRVYVDLKPDPVVLQHKIYDSARTGKLAPIPDRKYHGSVHRFQDLQDLRFLRGGHVQNLA